MIPPEIFESGKKIDLDPLSSDASNKRMKSLKIGPEISIVE